MNSPEEVLSRRGVGVQVYKNAKLIESEVNGNLTVLKFYLQECENLKPGKLLLLISDDFSVILSTTVALEKVPPEDHVFIKTIDPVGSTPDMVNQNYTLLETNFYVDTRQNCISTKELFFPFGNHFIQSETLTELPYYLKHKSVLKYGDLLLSTKSDDIWPSSKDLELDESQFEALKNALSKKFVLIQGGPGTGKTFIASKIIQILLENEKLWSKFGPMVILTSTNNGLNALLKNVSLCRETVVCIASHTEYEFLKSYSLSEKCKELSKQEDSTSYLFMEIKREIESILIDIQKCSMIIKYLETPYIIVPIEYLSTDNFFVKKFDSKKEKNKELFNWLTGVSIESLEEEESLCRDMIDLIEESKNSFCGKPQYSDIRSLFDYTDVKITPIKPIFPLNYFEKQIKSMRRKIEQLKSENSLDDLAALKEDLEIVIQEKSNVQQQLQNHPKVNHLYTSTGNPRWDKYWKSVDSSHTHVVKKKSELEERYLKRRSEFDKIMPKANLEVFREQKVIGLAASYTKKIESLLSDIGASIVLVEEADKIPEKIIFDLTRDCQHLICIGNERFELKTSTQKATFDLLSLEKITGIEENCKQLTYQHKMPSQIEKLFTILFGQKFDFYESCDHPNVQGLRDSIFFINTSCKNNATNGSHVQYFTKLCKYLLEHDYEPHDITILCVTSDQWFSFQDELFSVETLKEIDVCLFEDCTEIIEKKIVLVSLETHNDSVDAESLLYAALSRTRTGFYMIGDMDALCSKNPYWQKVKQVLEEENCIGRALRVKCENHLDQNIEVGPSDGRPFSCQIMVKVVLPKCKHLVEKPCFVPINEYTCPRDCDFRLNCGHVCEQKCHVLLDPEHLKYECTKVHINLIKRHEENDCSIIMVKKIKREDDENLCDKLLSCRHPNKGENISSCKATVKREVRSESLCGHLIANERNLEKRELVKFCRNPCSTTLACQHTCRGNCFECCQGRYHKSCTIECQNVLICGHKCVIPCDKECEPCTLPCELKCRHSKCKKSCGEPCILCREKCEFGCEHRRCTRLCFQLCNIDPCQESCKKMLECNHPCTGFCGDPCPPLCRICHKSQLEEIFFGNENDPNARYVLLPDCGCIMESEGLLKYITDFNTNSGVQLIRCPKCKVPINTCMRVMNFVKQSLADYEVVKRRIFFNDQENLEAKQAEYLDTLRKLESEPILNVGVFKCLPEYLKKLKVIRHRRQVLNFREINAMKLTLDVFLEIVKILKLLTNYSSDSQVYKFVSHALVPIIAHLPTSVLRFPSQLLVDIEQELRRLRLQVEVCNLSSASEKNFKKKFSQEQGKILYRRIYGVKRWNLEFENQVLRIINDSNNTIFQNRKEIVRAIGLKKGHWFKCPNGHFYIIDNCGGAMQRRKCIECDAMIGGRRHRLEGDNALAPEIDGATSPAYERKNKKKK